MSSVLTPPRRPSIGKVVNVANHAKVIVFGDSGSGKTTLLRTAPRPLLVVNIDNSIAPLRGLDGIDVVPDPAEGRPVSSWEEYVGIIDWLIAEGAREYATVAIDTATEAGELLRKYILGQKGPTNRVHPMVMSQADYGLFASLSLQELRRLRDLPCNVVLNAQTQDLVVDEVDGSTQLLRFASFGGGQKTPMTAPALFDMVGYLGVQETEEGLVRRMLVQPIANRRAKIRTQPGVEAPTVVNNPDLSELFKLITG